MKKLIFLALLLISGEALAGNTGTLIQYSNNGTPTAVSATTPLPIAGTFSATAAYAGNTGSAVPTQASYTGVNNGSGNLVGLSFGQALMAASLPVTLSSNQSALAVTGTFFQATQPISAVALPLPTGASTSALQTQISGQLPTTLGAKTTANSMAVNIASDQTVTTTDSANGSSTGGTAGTKSELAGGIFNTVLPTLTNAQQAALQLDSSGRQIMGTSAATIGAVGINAGVNLIGKVGIDQTTVGTTNAVSLAQVGANTVLTGNGVSGTGSQRVNIASDNTAFGVKPTDGVNTITVKAASTAAVAADTAMVVAISPNNGVLITPPVTGSGSAAAATVSTVITSSAPSNATGFILQNLDTSTANIRWAVGRTATTTLGQQLQPGRDTGYVPIGANVSIIAESGTQGYDIQWIAK